MASQFYDTIFVTEESLNGSPGVHRPCSENSQTPMLLWPLTLGSPRDPPPTLLYICACVTNVLPLQSRQNLVSGYISSP